MFTTAITAFLSLHGLAQNQYEVDFVDWYSVAASENGVKTNYINNGSTSLPEWVQITKPATDSAKVSIYSHAERETPGLTRVERQITGKLKWKITTSIEPTPYPIVINFGAEGRAEASGVVGTADTTVKSQGMDDNSKSATKELFLNTLGGDNDVKLGSNVMTRKYTPTWEPISGGWQAYVHFEFKRLYSRAVVLIEGGESPEYELVNEPEPGNLIEASAPTPRSAAFGKALTQLWSTPRSVPTYEQALTLDDGCLRIYGKSVGFKNDRMLVELFTGNGVPILGRYYTWVGVDGGADDEFYVDTTTLQQAGTYRLYLTPESALRRRFEFNFDGSSPIQLTTSYIWGDINGDNTITQWDIETIQRFMGMNQDHVYWLGGGDDPLYNMYGGHHCDLDHDGVVTQTDLGMAFANLGINGDQ